MLLSSNLLIHLAIRFISFGMPQRLAVEIVSRRHNVVKTEIYKKN